MPQPLEAVLNLEQRESFEITKFIFHIIQLDAKDEEEFVYLDEVELLPKQKQFFLERMRDVAEGTQYLFKTDAVHLKDKCINILAEPDRFIELSKHIAEDFSSRHNKSTSPGVFVIAVVKYLASAHNFKQLIFLVKMDGQPSFSYDYKIINGKHIATVTEVPNSLNETKQAVQKSALIDVSNVFVWDVLAFDRVNKTLGDYFKGFLGVYERQQDNVLTKIAHLTVKKWAKRLSIDEMPPGEDMNTYSARALNYLKDNDTFVTQNFIQTVIRDLDPERKELLSSQLKSELEAAGIAGQTFTPRPESLPKKQKKSIYETNEGVHLEWEGDNDAVGVTFTDLPGGRKRITIDTNKLTPKG